MDLKAVRIGIAPKPDDDSIGIVGMPVWMWARQPDAETVGPATATASAGGITVTATASLLKVTWSMGDGAKVVCTTAGTPYKPEFGMQSSPDCGHTYQTSSAGQEGDRFTVTATSSWVVSWSGAGTDRDHPAERAHPYGAGRGRRSAGARAVAGNET